MEKDEVLKRLEIMEERMLSSEKKLAGVYDSFFATMDKSVESLIQIRENVPEVRSDKGMVKIIDVFINAFGKRGK